MDVNLLIHVLIMIAAVVGTILLFGLSIFVHELGHFLVARRNGMKVERFSIGFGKTLWKKEVDGVEYRVGAIPAGGYVMLPQMEPMPLEGASQEEDRTSLPPVHPWIKIKVAFAGALFNMLFVIVLTSLVWMLGRPVESSRFSTQIGFIEPDSPAASSELMLGDTILEVDGRPVADYEELTQAVALGSLGAVTLKIEREGEVIELPVELEANSFTNLPYLGVYGASTPIVDGLSEEMPAQAAGVQVGDQIIEAGGEKIYSQMHLQDTISSWGTKPLELLLNRDGEEVRLTLTPAIQEGFEDPMIGVWFTERMVITHPNPLEQMKSFLTQMRDTLGALFSQRSKVGVKDLSGPVGIFNALQQMLRYDIRIALWFTAFLNLNLALLNLLPIPVLDGGHILFSLFEWIARRPLHPRIIYALHTIFTVLLISLLLFVTFHDISRSRKLGKMKNEAAEEEAQDSEPAGGDEPVPPQAEPVPAAP